MNPGRRFFERLGVLGALLGGLFLLGALLLGLGFLLLSGRGSAICRRFNGRRDGLRGLDPSLDALLADAVVALEVFLLVEAGGVGFLVFEGVLLAGVAPFTSLLLPRCPVASSVNVPHGSSCIGPDSPGVASIK